MQVAELKDHNIALRVEAGQLRQVLQDNTLALGVRDQEIARLRAGVTAAKDSAAAAPDTQHHWKDAALMGRSPQPQSGGTGPGKEVARLRSTLSASEAQRARDAKGHERELEGLRREAAELRAALLEQPQQLQQQRPRTSPATPDKRSVPPRRSSATSSRSDPAGGYLVVPPAAASLQHDNPCAGQRAAWASLGASTPEPANADAEQASLQQLKTGSSLADLEAEGLAELVRGLQEQCAALQAERAQRDASYAALQSEADHLRSELWAAATEVSARGAELIHWQEQCSKLQRDAERANAQLWQLGMPAAEQPLSERPITSDSHQDHPSMPHEDSSRLAALVSAHAGPSAEALAADPQPLAGPQSPAMNPESLGWQGTYLVDMAGSNLRARAAEETPASCQAGMLWPQPLQRPLDADSFDGASSSSGFADGDMDSLLRALEDAVCAGAGAAQESAQTCPAGQPERPGSAAASRALAQRGDGHCRLAAMPRDGDFGSETEKVLAARQELGDLRSDIAAALQRRSDLQRECDGLAARLAAAAEQLRITQEQVRC
jgi:regulator of replication initiation timing